MKTHNGLSGFTLVELSVVVTIIMLLASISLPNYWHAKELASFTACVQNRRVLEKAEGYYVLKNGAHSVGAPPVLIDEEYANPGTRCPCGGSYYWVLYPESDPRYHSEVGCSLHGSDKEHNSNLDPRIRPLPAPVPIRRAPVPVQPVRLRTERELQPAESR